MTSKRIELNWPKRWLRYSPDKTALSEVESGLSYTYRGLHEKSLQIARVLGEEFSIKTGDRICILSENHIDYIPLFFATYKLGAILVPLNFRLSEKEIEHILEDADPRLIIRHTNYRHYSFSDSYPVWDMPEGGLPVDGIDRSEFTTEVFAEEKPCLILYTSGTTGLPKGVMITPKMIFWNTINTILRLNLTSEDRTVSFLPYFHTGAWNVLLFPLLHCGGSSILMRKFCGDTVLKTSSEEKATIIFGVPTTMDFMSVQERFNQCDLSSVRFAIVGGEALHPSSIEKWHSKGIAIRQGYGLTEFGPNVFSLDAEFAKEKIGSIGKPNFYVDVKLIDDSGRELIGPATGELCLRGPVCTPGYWNNPKQTVQAFLGDWLKTGDVLKRDADDFYYVVGRKKDMYISGGENVYPAEVERVIRLHPDVSEVAIVGVPDNKWGEVGHAFVVKSMDDLSTDSLKMFCQKQLAKYKHPKHYSFIEELPKSESGKIIKHKLKQLAQTHANPVHC